MRLLLLSAILLLTSCSKKEQGYKSCYDDREKQLKRSEELQKIVKEDQADRIPAPSNPEEWAKVHVNDERRRMRVAEIFAEGCFKAASDYAAAALVFQHGNRPDHFFQTFLWAKEAATLGDKKYQRLAALGVDRYLVNLGKKQLFASQAFKNGNEKCWCLQPVEEGFSDKLRKQFSGKTLAESLAWIDSLNHGSGCSKAQMCSMELKSPEPNSIPGFW